jgi:competence protein ComGC
MERTHRYFVWILKVAFLVLITLGIIYLLLLNSLATQGFVLEDLKAERLAIQKELEAVEIEMAIPSSLYALQSSEQVQEMAEIDEMYFIHINNGEMAYVKSGENGQFN